MNFTMHYHKAASKANQALGMIKRNFKYMSNSSLMILYKTFVRPHLEYCVPQFGALIIVETLIYSKGTKKSN